MESELAAKPPSQDQIKVKEPADGKENNQTFGTTSNLKNGQDDIEKQMEDVFQDIKKQKSLDPKTPEKRLQKSINSAKSEQNDDKKAEETNKVCSTQMSESKRDLLDNSKRELGLEADGAMVPAAGVNQFTVVAYEFPKECEIKGCQNEWEYICDEQIWCCSYGWSPCARKICAVHSLGSAHCHSDPITKCEKTYNSSYRKQKISIIIPVLLLIGIAYWLYEAFKPPNRYLSPYWDVSKNYETNMITMHPLAPYKHESTIIYLHDYGETNDEMFDIFADKQNSFSFFAPATSRIVLPQADTIQLDVLAGQVPSTNIAWWNLKAGSLNPAKPLGTKLDQRDDLYDQSSLLQSTEKILKLINLETSVLTKRETQRIILMGYGMGCMTALATFLKYEGESPLGGVICISGLQPLQNIPTATKAQQETPMFVYHGDIDNEIYVQDAKQTIDVLMKSIYTGEYAKNYKFREEPALGHYMSTYELRAIQKNLVTITSQFGS